MLNSFI